MWVNKHKLNNSLVVFVHGLWGNWSSTWRGIPELLQQLFPVDPSIRSYDFYLFRYDTSLLKQPALRPYVLDKLANFLKGVGGKYRTTVLIGHSQGGILQSS